MTWPLALLLASVLGAIGYFAIAGWRSRQRPGDSDGGGD